MTAIRCKWREAKDTCAQWMLPHIRHGLLDETEPVIRGIEDLRQLLKDLDYSFTEDELRWISEQLQTTCDKSLSQLVMSRLNWAPYFG